MTGIYIKWRRPGLFAHRQNQEQRHISARLSDVSELEDERGGGGGGTAHGEFVVLL